ncbi:hypothetical protein DC3_08840 [Deinococcus cellulosilyticus NBRC 106333 = KACC 11606]|uniref:Uncharacterized protein n=2 Tax=Deinococcus cellulosilyticus TaxID=401558 RepID=A0A511MXE7_DEIC1|nr:hypothetical protein DC3_08840 [Deinococcus cellulosilyticus NBRC 106333 = KACC 11606]
MDAASGDLYAYAHNKMPCSRGSSIYQMRDWSVHSMGLICHQEGWLYYDRPGQVFYRSEHEPDFEHPISGVPVQRSEGLLAVQGRIREYEQWIQSRRGPHHREALLSGKLPARVRRETEAWKQWISRDPLEHQRMLLPEGHSVVILR